MARCTFFLALLAVLAVGTARAQDLVDPTDVDFGSVDDRCLDLLTELLEICDEEVEGLSELADLEPEEAAQILEEMGGVDISEECCAALKFSNAEGCNCDPGVLALVTDFGFEEEFEFLQTSSAEACNYELIGGSSCPTAGGPAPAPEEEDM